jgi:hypothetical protein
MAACPLGAPNLRQPHPCPLHSRLHTRAGASPQLAEQNEGVGAVPEVRFVGDDLSDREQWRSIVLFGRNVASYKFALAKSLLELAADGSELVHLEDLAVPFARHICEHLRLVDRQGTFARSRFLDACRFFNAGTITADELRDATTLLGFVNVIDAFHIVGSEEMPTRFYIDERKANGGIRLTDDLLELAELPEAGDLLGEAEARWRLVEEAWSARADGEQVVVLYDAPRELLVPALTRSRRSLTEVRPALNGYQKGHCFYCFAPISITSPTPETAADVDHFFPHVLMSRGLGVNVDLPWNLVLACTNCNRGPAGKFADLPRARFLERLHARNEFLIRSHHPLRESLLATMGPSADTRRRFLNEVLADARLIAGTATGWAPREEGTPLF